MNIKHKIINIRPRTVLQFIQPLTWNYHDSFLTFIEIIWVINEFYLHEKSDIS